MPFDVPLIEHQLQSAEARKREAAVLRANIEKFVDAVMEGKHPLVDLLNESFSMEMLELLFKRMTSKLRSILFDRSRLLELFRIAMDTQLPLHTRTMATSFLVVGNAGNSMVPCDAANHKCHPLWEAVLGPLYQEAHGAASNEDGQSDVRASVTELEAMIQVEVRSIEADGARSLQRSFLEKDHEQSYDDEQDDHEPLSPCSSAWTSTTDDRGSEPMSPSASPSARFEDVDDPPRSGSPSVNLAKRDDDELLLNIFSSESANLGAQILLYYAVRAQKGACILHFLACHEEYVTLLLANIGHDDIRTFLLHLVYSDHSTAAIQSLFKTRMFERLIQKLLTFAPPRNSFERDAIENTFLLLREVIHAPYLTSRGVAISAKTIPMDRVTGQNEYVSICGASREMANSSFRKYTSRKVRRVVHLFMQHNQAYLEQLFGQMIKELTFWSTPVRNPQDRRKSVASMASFALLAEGHPRPSCTTMLMHLFELTETVELGDGIGKSAGVSALTNVGIDCMNFMCSTHMIRSSQLKLKLKLKNELQPCQISLNCMMGVRVTSLREDTNGKTAAFGDGFVHNQKGNQITFTLDEIESVEASDWHEHGFVIKVRKKRAQSKQLSQLNAVGIGPDVSAGHDSELHRTTEFFAANSEEEKKEWIALIQAAINGDLNELEIFCSDDWRSNIKEYRQLRECLISCMERRGYELMVFLKQSVLEGTRKASGYHLWTILKLLYAVVANESKRLDQMFVSAQLIDVLVQCYEKFPMWTLLLGEISKIIIFYFGDFKDKRSRRCPVLDRLLASDDSAFLLPLLSRVFISEQGDKSDGSQYLSGTDALSNLKLVLEAIRTCVNDPKTRSHERVQSVVKNDRLWQKLLAAVDADERRNPSQRITSVGAPVTQASSTSKASHGSEAAPRQPAFQEDIINQITRPCYSSAYGFGSSFLLGDGCAFGYLFKERRCGQEWQKALVVYEYVSYKLWYFYPSEVDETQRITWKWVVPISVRTRYTHGQDGNRTSIGHHGLYVTTYDHQAGANDHQGVATRELHFSVTKLEDRDMWKDVLSKAASTIRQLSQDYNVMYSKMKKPDRKTVTHCQVCSTQFKIYRRPHACHRCGKWLCGKCTQHRKAIPEVGLMTPVRHCKQCFDASGGAKADVEPVQLFRHSSTSSDGLKSLSRKPVIHGADNDELSHGLSNLELYELAHGLLSPRAMMRANRHNSIDSPTGGYRVDEVDTKKTRRFFSFDDKDTIGSLTPSFAETMGEDT